MKHLFSQNKVFWRGWAERLQISLYFYSPSQTPIIPVYKNLSELSGTLSSCSGYANPSRPGFLPDISQCLCPVPEEGRASTRTFRVVFSRSNFTRW